MAVHRIVCFYTIYFTKISCYKDTNMVIFHQITNCKKKKKKNRIQLSKDHLDSIQNKDRYAGYHHFC